jgi:hypothetical protein
MSQDTNPMAVMINNLLTGYGNSVIMYDKDGQKVMDPNKATRFFCKEKSMMVEIGKTLGSSPRPEVIFHISDQTPKEQVEQMKTQLNQHNLYDYCFSVKPYGKQLEPKHFSGRVTESVWTGSTRTSRFPVGECWVVIRHQGRLNTEQNPRRWTKISDVFIHHPNGTRYKWDHKHLLGAKAMAQHMHQQGHPWDEQGQNIHNIMQLIQELRRFKKWSRDNKPHMCDLAGECQHEIKSLLHKLCNDTTYPIAIESINSLCDTVKNNISTVENNQWPHDCNHAISLVQSRMPREQPLEIMDSWETDNILDQDQDSWQEQKELNEWFQKFDPRKMFERESISLPDAVDTAQTDIKYHSSTEDPQNLRDVYNKVKDLVTGLDVQFLRDPKAALSKLTRAVDLVNSSSSKPVVSLDQQ